MGPNIPLEDILIDSRNKWVGSEKRRRISMRMGRQLILLYLEGDIYAVKKNNPE